MGCGWWQQQKAYLLPISSITCIDKKNSPFNNLTYKMN